MEVNGKKIVEKRTVTVYEFVQTKRTLEVEKLKATDAAGKAHCRGETHGDC